MALSRRSSRRAASLGSASVDSTAANQLGSFNITGDRIEAQLGNGAGSFASIVDSADDIIINGASLSKTIDVVADSVLISMPTRVVADTVQIDFTTRLVQNAAVIKLDLGSADSPGFGFIVNLVVILFSLC